MLFVQGDLHRQWSQKKLVVMSSFSKTHPATKPTSVTAEIIEAPCDSVQGASTGGI